MGFNVEQSRRTISSNGPVKAATSISKDAGSLSEFVSSGTVTGSPFTFEPSKQLVPGIVETALPSVPLAAETSSGIPAKDLPPGAHNSMHYKIKSGDSLEKVARNLNNELGRTDLTASTLAKLNGIKNKNQISVGQLIRFASEQPQAQTVPVIAGQVVNQAAKQTGDAKPVKAIEPKPVEKPEANKPASAPATTQSTSQPAPKEVTVASGDSVFSLVKREYGRSLDKDKLKKYMATIQIKTKDGKLIPFNPEKPELKLGQTLLLPFIKERPALVTTQTDKPAVSKMTRTWPGIEPDFLAAVCRIADKYQFNPDALMGVMAAETGGTFDPKQKAIGGKTSATGLIQFTNNVVPELGTTTDALSKMTRMQQLVYVEKFLDLKFEDHPGAKRDIDVYAAVFSPTSVGSSLDSTVYGAGTSNYNNNKSLDANKDGKIQLSELNARLTEWTNRYSTTQPSR